MSKEAPKKLVSDVLNNCLAGRIWLLNRVLTSILDEKFRQLGIRNGQFTMLCVPARMGRLKPVQMQKVMQMDASTVSRNVQRMREHGWVRIIPDDERSHFLEVTSEGRKMIRVGFPVWKAAQAQARELLGEVASTGVQSAAGRTLERILDQV